MTHFEELLSNNSCYVERYVKFRLNSTDEIDDVLQEIYLAAFNNFGQLKNKDSFKAWLISIARNKCNDYLKIKANMLEIPIDAITEQELFVNRYGISERTVVRETFDMLGDKDKQILYLYFWKDLPQAEIARLLNIPIGTVKSRLYVAKQNFKNKYPFKPNMKGENNMNKLPEILPEYKIEKSSNEPFEVKWEELMGWFIVPKLGEKLSWGMYNLPSRKCSHICNMKVTKKAVVHGIEGVELTARETTYTGKEVDNRTFIVQLTDTNCRYLAVVQNEGDVRNYVTFLDVNEFIPDWGFGEDNCGKETSLFPKGDIKRMGNTVTASDKKFLLDIVGRYNITINGKCYDTVCVMNIETNNCGGVVLEQFLDENGKTILLRRYNQDDWAINSYKKKWSELLPENEQLIVNGKIYVHWYDCITDYIL